MFNSLIKNKDIWDTAHAWKTSMFSHKHFKFMPCMLVLKIDMENTKYSK